MAIRAPDEGNKIFQNIPALFTNRPSVLQNIMPIRGITEYNIIFQNILTLTTALVFYRIFCPNKILHTKCKNGPILPTGQWYAPSAVVSEASYCQGCISCGILLSGTGARGVSSEHMENMEMFSCSPT